MCSGDDTAERLAMKYKVDVVISASGLKCLLDNSAPVYPQSWELPVGVREYPGEGKYPLAPKVFPSRHSQAKK